MTEDQPLSFCWLSDIEMPLANKFYRIHKFRGKPRRHGPCAALKDHQQQIVACGYLKSLDDCSLLSGVAVAPEHQQKGFARQLLTEMSETFTPLTFTFPYQHLVPFYESVGFVDVDVAGLPEAILERFNAYQRQGRSIVIMQYSGTSP